MDKVFALLDYFMLANIGLISLKIFLRIKTVGFFSNHQTNDEIAVGKSVKKLPMSQMGGAIGSAIEAEPGVPEFRFSEGNDPQERTKHVKPKRMPIFLLPDPEEEETLIVRDVEERMIEEKQAEMLAEDRNFISKRFDVPKTVTNY